MKNLIKPLAKSVLISLGLTASAPESDAGIRKKPYDPVTFRPLLRIKIQY